MKTLFYFHGLQSKQGGEKIDYLTRSFLVHAPVMVYKQPYTWPQTLAKVAASKPDFIVGSSMGGLMSFFSGYSQDCRMLLFNPAFDRISQYIDDWHCEASKQRADIQIVLGSKDTEVDPHNTLRLLQEQGFQFRHTILDFQHRVPYDIFTQQVEKMLQN